MGPGTEWYDAVVELIDMRSFSNLWYWIALAVQWSWASHFVIGIPFDMVVRARRRGGQAESDLEDMVRVSVNRILIVESMAGVWLLGFASFLLTTLGLLGFFYGAEFAQALFLLAAPMTVVGILTLSGAKRIAREQPKGTALQQRIATTRFWIQLTGMISIFVTAMWGMYYNVTQSLLYG